MKNYIIVGNGIAANAAAESIRNQDSNGKIIMFARENMPFYYAPALPEYIAGEKSLKDIIIHDDNWYKTKNIDLFLNTEITGINPEEKTVTTGSGQAFHYDRLLLATGGFSFIPPIKGADSNGVFSLRNLSDADKIKQKASTSRHLVLIGGGLLGLEAGNGLRKTGLEITVVEFFPRLMPRQMDVEGAAILRNQLEQLGFSFFLGAKTKEIQEVNSSLEVNLESGEKLPADMVLISAGVRPEVSLARSIGIDIDKAVKTDDSLKTGIEDIYAAGDIAEHRGRFYGIWPASMDQGRIAGLNMAGKTAQYDGTVPSNNLKVAGIDLVSAGNIDAEEKLKSIVNKSSNVYRKIVIENNTIAGAILLGDIRGSKEIIEAIKTRTDISCYLDNMGDKNFDFSVLKNRA